jgi:hypothetical protein
VEIGGQPLEKHKKPRLCSPRVGASPASAARKAIADTIPKVTGLVRHIQISLRLDSGIYASPGEKFTVAQDWYPSRSSYLFRVMAELAVEVRVGIRVHASLKNLSV